VTRDVEALDVIKSGGIAMRQVLISIAVLGAFVIGLTTPSTPQAAQAAQAAGGLGPCAQITAACKSAGFTPGGASTGTGLQVDCIAPLMQGKAQPPQTHIPLPNVDSQLVADCKARNPSFGEPSPSRQAERPAAPRPAAPPPSSELSSAVANVNGIAGSNSSPAAGAVGGQPATPIDSSVQSRFKETTGIQHGAPSNGPIVVNWHFKKDPGSANLIVNPDGTYLFSGNYQRVPSKDLEVVIVLKSTLGGHIGFSYVGNVSNGAIQWSKQGQSVILKENFHTFAGKHDWTGYYRLWLTASARKAQHDENVESCKKFENEMNFFHGAMDQFFQGDWTYCQSLLDQ
jgi:hypothetical protein